MSKVIEDQLSAKTTSLLLKSSALCKFCLTRQGVSPKYYVKGSSVHPPDCEICGGLLSRLPSISRAVTKELRGYEFASFLVGTTISQRILDKEDEIRSKFKIKGREGIKAQITKSISNHVSQYTRKKIDYNRPELTLLVTLPDGSVSLNPRSIWLFLKYLKTKRGLAQRSTLCSVCNGVGCANCNYKGIANSSIQNQVTVFLCKKFKAENCNFIWIGSEDENSLVSGNGRPFYVEILRPKLRKVSRNFFRKMTNLDGVGIIPQAFIATKPRTSTQFMMKCLVYLMQKPEEGQEANFHLSKEDIESKFRERSVQVKLSRKFRIVTRIVHSVEVKKVDDHHPYVLDIDCDGGIPIRKLVSGQDQIVSPNLSSFIHGLEVDPEMPFDILDISFSTAETLAPNPHKADANKKPRNWQQQKELSLTESSLSDSDLILEEC